MSYFGNNVAPELYNIGPRVGRLVAICRLCPQGDNVFIVTGNAEAIEHGYDAYKGVTCPKCGTYEWESWGEPYKPGELVPGEQAVIEEFDEDDCVF